MLAGNLLLCGCSKRALGTALGSGAALTSHAAGSSFGILTYGLAFALAGLGASAVQLAASTVVLDVGTEADRPAYIGLAVLGQLLFAYLGPLLGGTLADRLGDGVLFVLGLVLGLAGAGVVRRWVRDPRRSVSSGPS